MQPWVRIAGRGVLWQQAGFGNTEVDEWISSTLPGGRRSPAVYTTDCGTGGRPLGPIATGALVYSVFRPTTDAGCDLGHASSSPTRARAWSGTCARMSCTGCG
jgi:hypothetical protein